MIFDEREKAERLKANEILLALGFVPTTWEHTSIDVWIDCDYIGDRTVIRGSGDDEVEVAAPFRVETDDPRWFGGTDIEHLEAEVKSVLGGGDNDPPNLMEEGVNTCISEEGNDG